MRALVLQDFGKLYVEEVAEPEPGPDEVLIDVIAVGICGSDVHGYTGENGRRRAGQIMGHELVGRVRRLGSNVRPTLEIRRSATVTVDPVLFCGDCRSCQTGAEQACPNKRVIGVIPDPSVPGLGAPHQGRRPPFDRTTAE